MKQSIVGDGWLASAASGVAQACQYTSRETAVCIPENGATIESGMDLDYCVRK